MYYIPNEQLILVSVDGISNSKAKELIKAIKESAPFTVIAIECATNTIYIRNGGDKWINSRHCAINQPWQASIILCENDVIYLLGMLAMIYHYNV